MILWLGLSLSIYAVAMIALGIVAGRRIENEEDYLVSGRRLPLWLAWGTLLATWFGAATVMGASEAAREEGVRGTVLDPFASGIALLVAGAFLARRLWEMRLLTVGDLFGRRFGPRTEIVASIVQSISYLPWIAAQYLALATVLKHFFGIEIWIAVCCIAIFVSFLTTIGGMWSVTLTDTAQIILVLASLVVLGDAFFSAIGNGSLINGVTSTWQQTPSDALTLLPSAGIVATLGWTATVLNGVLGNLPGQDLMQRVFAAKSGQVARAACLLAGVVYILFGLIPVGLGLASRLLWPDSLPEGDSHVLLSLAEHFLTPPLICLFVVAMVSIIVSTCTSAMLAPSALIAHNLLHRMPWFHSRRLLTDRLSVSLVTVASIPLAFSTGRILGLLEEAFSIAVVALLVPFMAGVFLAPRGEKPGLYSILAGTTFFVGHRLILWWGVDVESSTLATLVDAIPAEFTGVMASISGYWLGQRTSPPTPHELRQD